MARSNPLPFRSTWFVVGCLALLVGFVARHRGAWEPLQPSEPAGPPLTPVSFMTLQPDPFPDAQTAPSLEGGVGWLNVAGPIDLKDLRGKFVVLDFWTYCCINCMHVLPELKKLERAYRKHAAAGQEEPERPVLTGPGLF